MKIPPATNVIVLSSLLLALNLTPIIIANPIPLLNRTWYVDDDNVDGPWDGTLEHPYQHINDATVNVSANDTVYVFNGTYHEQVYMETPVKLLGENKFTTIIDGGGVSGSTVVCHAYYITVKGFTITNSGHWPGDAGVWITDKYAHHSAYDIIEDNLITRNTGGSINIYDTSSFNKFENNTIKDNAGGLAVSGSNNRFVRNILINDSMRAGGTGSAFDSNSIQNGSLTIYDIDSGSISNNTFSDGASMSLTSTPIPIVNNSFVHAKGITISGELEELEKCTMQGNTIDGRPIYYWCQHSNDAIPTNASEIIAVDCSKVHIEDLTISDSYGITTISCNQMTIANNTLTNTDGITILSSPHCTVAHNTLTDSSLSLYDSNSCSVLSNTLSGGSMVSTKCSFTSYQDNSIRNVSTAGIYVIEGKLNTIQSNVIAHTKVAVELNSTLLTTVASNDFIDSSWRDAYFIATGLLRSKNTWQDNYWEAPSDYPVIIHGIFNTHFTIPGNLHDTFWPIINIDKSPAKMQHSFQADQS